MSSTNVATLIKMVEALPDAAQAHVLEHLREYIEDMRDEAKWDTLFAKTQTQLEARAKHARQEIAKGKGKPLDYDEL